MAQTAPPVLRVSFEDGKVGRQRGVAPFEVTGGSPDSIASQVHKKASKYLLSRGIDVDLDIDPDTNVGEGIVVVGGFRTVAAFTIAPVEG